MLNDDENTIHNMQIYSLLESSSDKQNKLFDFTEHKLLKFGKMVKDENQKIAIEEIIKRYKEGRIAVGWNHGIPMWTPIK